MIKSYQIWPDISRDRDIHGIYQSKVSKSNYIYTQSPISVFYYALGRKAWRSRVARDES